MTNDNVGVTVEQLTAEQQKLLEKMRQRTKERQQVRKSVIERLMSCSLVMI